MNSTTGKFIFRNFIKMLLLLFAVSIAAFALMTASPIDPLKANVGQTALGSMSQEQIAKLEEYWGVGKPPVQRYLAWFKDFVRGDMGVSLLYPSESNHSDCCQTRKFTVSDDHSVGSVRLDRIPAGCSVRNETWKTD